jgi:hypothetical protein
MDMTQELVAVSVVFILLVAAVYKFGKPARPGGWLAGVTGTAKDRRIDLIESRALATGCRLYLVRVDRQEFLLAQTGASCTAVASWTKESQQGCH